MFHDEFYYRPKLSSPLWFGRMVFEGEGDGGGDGGGGDGGGESWLDEHSYLSDEDRQAHSKYKTLEESLKGSAHAIRQVGKSVHWPDDKTSDEDKETFDAKIHTYQGVPDKPEGYKIDRSGIPENVEYDEEMETNFRQWASESKAPQSVIDKFVAGYNKMMLGRHEAMEKVAKAAEKELRDDKDFDFDVKLGKEGDKENIGTIKEGLLQLSAELKLDYKDPDDGSPRSHLIDDLEFLGKNGSLGNRVTIIKALDSLLTFRYGEATTVLGDPANKGKAGGEPVAFSKEWYETTDSGKEV